MISTPNRSGTRPVSLISGYRGLAKSFLDHLHRAGHQLSVLVRKPEAIPDLATRYPKAFFFPGDIASWTAALEWIRATIEAFGRIDFLINNAAITGPGGRLHEVEFDEIEEAVRIDLLAPVFLCQQVLPHFLKAERGTIINLSGGGATSPRPFFSPYGFSKTALVRFTETLAEEYPQLRFYAISPGFLKTPMVESVLKMDPSRIGKEYEQAKARVEKGGEDPNRAAELALWLFENQPEALNGKLISAIWDDYRNPLDYPKSVGWWTLRRVDEVCVRNLTRANS